MSKTISHLPMLLNDRFKINRSTVFQFYQFHMNVSLVVGSQPTTRCVPSSNSYSVLVTITGIGFFCFTISSIEDYFHAVSPLKLR